MSVEQLQQLHSHGRPPWPNGMLGLGGTELLDWGRYVLSDGVVCPLFILADRGDPVWNPAPSFPSSSAPPSSSSRSPQNGSSYSPLTTTTSSSSSATATAGAPPISHPSSTGTSSYPLAPSSGDKAGLSTAFQPVASDASLKRTMPLLSLGASDDGSSSDPHVVLKGYPVDESTDVEAPSPVRDRPLSFSTTVASDSSSSLSNSNKSNTSSLPATARTTASDQTSSSLIVDLVSASPKDSNATAASSAHASAPVSTSLSSSSSSSSHTASTRKLRFSEEPPSQGETYHKEDYERALDPGEGLSHLGELFQKNNADMSAEQEQEVKDSVKDVRLRGYYIERGDADDLGIEISHIPRGMPGSPDFSFSEVVIIKGLTANGAAARDGRLHVNDRIVIINTQWILCLSHANFLLGALRDAPAIDITISRDEPLPPAPSFADYSDTELEAAAYEHAGLRVRIGPASEAICWTRDQVVGAISDRFLGGGGGLGASDENSIVAQGGAAPVLHSENNATTSSSSSFPSSLTVSFVAATPSADSAAHGSASSEGQRKAGGLLKSNKGKPKRRIVFHDAIDFAETYHKEDYERALDPGEGLSHLGELFQKNNADMSAEQEQEVKDSVKDVRLRGFYIERGDLAGFGISIAHIPRYTPESPDLIYSEVVYITALDPDMAAARDGRLRVNDRVVIINSQWILCLSHANFLLGALRDAPAIDITISRNEPLPPAPNLLGMTDQELESEAFENLGLRVRIGPEWDPVCWAREQVLATIMPRFQ